MKTMALVVSVLCLGMVNAVWAHGGGLDGYGCHHNRKAGGYHCHRGALAGEHFASQAEMLQRLNATAAPTTSTQSTPSQNPTSPAK